MLRWSSAVIACLLCGNRQGEVCLEGLRYVAARRVGCYMCRDGGFARSWELHTRYYCAVALGADEKRKRKIKTSQ